MNNIGPKGRGAGLSPPNRFEHVRREADLEHLEQAEDAGAGEPRAATEYLPDASRSIVTQNDSPDIPFRYSMNPYRGCAHGCAYCYARPTHEYLGMSAGLDFERKVLVKHDAAELFRAFLNRPEWIPEPISVSSVTDCYQPAERHFRITRGLLEAALEARQPLGVITKNALIERDLDLLSEMARLRVVQANVSITTLDAALARSMEPQTSTPQARLRAIRALADAGVPVRVMVAPIIPGLTDRETPAILAAAADAGAQCAGYVLLRLPLAVKPIFLDWLERHQPLARDRVVALMRDTHGGKLNDSRFGTRMRGAGPFADQIRQMFHTFVRKHKLDAGLPEYNLESFRPPRLSRGQLRLF